MNAFWGPIIVLKIDRQLATAPLGHSLFVSTILDPMNVHVFLGFDMMDFVALVRQVFPSPYIS